MNTGTDYYWKTEKGNISNYKKIKVNQYEQIQEVSLRENLAITYITIQYYTELLNPIDIYKSRMLKP